MERLFFNSYKIKNPLKARPLNKYERDVQNAVEKETSPNNKGFN